MKTAGRIAVATASLMATTAVEAAASPVISGAFTNFAGVDVAGAGDRTLRLGGRLDVYGALPVGDRVTLNFHPELVYGQNVNSNADGSILPLNTALLLPSNGGEDFDLSVNATIRLGAKSTLMIGKINLLDLVARTPIVGGGGLEGFQNIMLAAPPSGLVPPSLIGGILTVPTSVGNFGFWVFDPANQTNKTGFESPFSTGVTFLASATIPVKIGGLQGFQNLKGSANTKTGFDLSDLPTLLLPPGTVLPGQKRGAWNITYSFQQYLWQSTAPGGPGWGIFGQFSVSDGNPTPLDLSGFIGISGNPWPDRPADRFGVAYFRQSFSNVLVEALAPVLAVSAEQGVEAYYTIPVGKAWRLTADVQIIDPAGTTKPTAVVVGARLKAGF
jgi:porin